MTGRGGLTFEEALTSEFLSGDGEAPEQVGLPPWQCGGCLGTVAGTA